MAQIQTYEVQGENGQVYEIQSDHQPTRIEAAAAIRAMQGASDMAASRDRLAKANAAPINEPTTFLDGAIRGFRGAADYAPVTAGDVMKDPSEALSRTGAIIRRDLTDPKTAAAIAASVLVPKAVDGTISGIQSARENFADPIKSAIGKRLGVDSDALDLQSARLRLQAARSRTRVAKFERQQAEAAVPPDPSASGAKTPQPLILTPEQLQMHQQQMANAELLAKEQGMRSAAYGRAAWRNPQAAPQPASTLPVETSSAPAPRSAASAPAAESAAPPSSSSNPIEALQKAGLSPEEADQAIRWARQGVDLDQVLKRINATRALMRGKPALKDLPTLQEALNEVRSR